jgi:hypothetical protein
MTGDSFRKRKERIKLAREIEDRGFEMTPCSCCEKENRKCVMDSERSSRCAECVRRKRSCDGLSDAWERNVPSERAWTAIERQEAVLEEQEEAAAVAAQEAMARVARLRKQRQQLRKRKTEMSRRGLRFLEELDAQEERERFENEVRAAGGSPPLINDAVDLSAVLGMAGQEADQSFWESVEFGDEIPLTTQGS